MAVVMQSIHNSPIEAYVGEITRKYGHPRGPLSSLILFGSAATGAYSPGVSDVDLLVVLRDDVSLEERESVRSGITALEVRYEMNKSRTQGRGALRKSLISFAERVTANVRAFFICSRADLLSGEPARIFGISRAQARFVDRVAIPSILASGVTVWGEQLLNAVPLPPIRRFDVAKALFGLLGQAVFAATWYPLLPDATKYSMDALKRSIHNCYFCHHLRPASLGDEVAFFVSRDGDSHVLAQLLELRRNYRTSYRFVIAYLPAIVRLHWRTARLASFPRAPQIP